MDENKIEIELNKEEYDLINEIKNLQKQADRLDASKMNDNLLEKIKETAINSIASSLGVSDFMEVRAAHTGLDYDKAYKAHLKNPSGRNTDGIPSAEFDKMIEKGENLKYNRNELTGQYFKESISNLRSDNPDGFFDVYTGKFHIHGDDYDYEHIRSAKEVSLDVVFNEFTTLEERALYTNSKENLSVTGRELNKSKNDTKIKDFDKWRDGKAGKDSSKTREEYFAIDNNKTNEAIEKSEKKRADILKNKIRTYDATTTTKIAASNALKSGLKAAVGKLISISIVEIISEYQRNEEVCFKVKVNNIKARIKDRSADIMKTFKDFSIGAFISTFVDALLKSVFKIAKNIFKFIKAGFQSIIKAIKVLFSKDYTIDEKLDQCLKILGGTLVVMIGIGLDEIIEKAIVSTFPFMAGTAGLISPVISGLIVGIGSVLLLQAFEKYQNKIEYSFSKSQQIDREIKLSKVAVAKAGVSNIKAIENVLFSVNIFGDAVSAISSFKKEVEDSFNNMALTKEQISQRNNDIDKAQDETDRLLGDLSSLI